MRHEARLGPTERVESFRRLGSEPFDVVVIGGGVVGCGVALDAATRGLSVALVEARDLACGTSSRSSKLFHGGLRYLEMLEFGLVREALRERDLMLTRLCPHLAKPVSFLYPLTGLAERLYVGCGLILYDTMGRSRTLPRHRHLTRSGALRLAPGLKRTALKGAVRYCDGLVDDARHTMTVARTAARYGALVRTGTRAVGFVKEADRLCGVRVRDTETGEETTVRCSVVINSTGVWTEQTQSLSGDRGRFSVRASKGVHILVGRDRIPGDTGIIVRTERSVLLVTPWKSQWIIGTTDTDWRLDGDDPIATAADIDYLLDHVNTLLAVPLTRADVEGVYAGLRPLLAGKDEPSSKLSRKHAANRVAPGLVAVAGGKYTTYRLMAADAVDAAATDLTGPVNPSFTENVPLLGADGYRALVNRCDQLADDYGLHPYRVRGLLDRYGSLIHEVLAPGLTDRRLLEPLPGAAGYLGVEVRYAASHEGALHLEDVLARRTRISMEYPHGGTQTAAAVADLMAEVLGWSDERRRHELDTYLADADAETRAQAERDDESAVQVRAQARAIRTGPKAAATA